MKVVINKCYGGFGLSEAAYEKLISYGVPVRKYIEQKKDPETGRYLSEPANDGEVIFDRSLSPENPHCSKSSISFFGRYWDCWTSKNRAHPLLVKVVEELGEAADGSCAMLSVIEIPDDVNWEIDEYDGIETVREKSRSWG